MAAKKHERKPPSTTPSAPDDLRILDLTGAVDRRPTVKLDTGEYRMILVEELTFTQFADQADIGKRLIAVAEDLDNPNMLDELQTLVVRGVQMILVDMDDEAAQAVTPGQYLRITAFFNLLDDVTEATSSAIGSSDAPDANDSSEASEAA